MPKSGGLTRDGRTSQHERLGLMGKGLVFDVREFTVHDGPGMRTTVFMKGCPLRCTWCHNPEGLEPVPQRMRSTAGERTVGRYYETEELAEILNGQADILAAAGGGVTFSGGEPLMQARFVAEVIDLLRCTHVVLDTSGHAPRDAFMAVVERCDLVLLDIKLADPLAHRRWTGQDNGPILANLALLESLSRAFVARIPLVPGVTDTRHNLEAIARLLTTTPTLAEVQLLPYNRAAGGKYAALGMPFAPGYDEDREPAALMDPFTRVGIEVRVA
jgi:pyruvate formate lyase activating enzyme